MSKIPIHRIRRSAEVASPSVLKLLPQFSKPRRNEVRGTVARIRENGISDQFIEIIRDNASEPDMNLAGELLEAPYGLRQRPSKGLKQDDLWPIHNIKDKSLELEIAYVSGYLNSWPEDTLKAIGTIQLFSKISEVAFEDACSAVEACAREWGASKYICYKIAFLKMTSSVDSSQSRALINSDQILSHKDSPALQYSALENITSKISLFSVARRHTNILKTGVGKNFRRSHSLSNLVATPVSQQDAAAFLHRASETSLIDTVHGIWVLSLLSNRFTDVKSALKRNLNPDIFNTLTTAIRDVAQLPTPNFFDKLAEDESTREDPSEQLYRQSAAFLEYPRVCEYRNNLDRVIGLRLISSLLPKMPSWSGADFNDKDALRKQNTNFTLSKYDRDIEIDTFYRTYLFLRFIQNPLNLSLMSEDDVKFVFNNTVGLDALLLETELQTMHLNASDNTRPLISVLALALYRGRSSDPDIDFDYRLKLEQHIIDNFDGNIPEFIKSLTEETPQVANYIAASLDEATIEKMYSLVNTARQSREIRRDILNIIGSALNRIEYIIEAEAIETRIKVSKLKQYFEASRMFVDSVVMREWLEANPSAYTQQCKELLPKLVARFTNSVANVTDSNTGEIRKFPIVEISSTIDHLVQQIGKEAFHQFCVNNEFGIESYLGRRIRHNTLHGVMIKPIDAILSNYQNNPIIVGTPFGQALEEWEAYYRSYIERMRKEFLQFSSSKKPNALFDPNLDLNDSTTLRSVSQLSKSLEMSGTEMLSDLIIAFCWQQIGPQLDYASRHIKVNMAGIIKLELEQCLEKFEGPEEKRIFLDLSKCIEEVFATVASWFRQPDTGFVPATIREICKIIDIEFGRVKNLTNVNGNSLDTEYYGISVHRLYDCLAVLIQNAHKHGERHGAINVLCNSLPIDGTNLHRASVSVRSRVDQGRLASEVQRINDALSSEETGKDMVTEGFSGLKKLKYITKLNEGLHTVTLKKVGTEIELGFSLKVEVTAREVGNETNSSSRR